MKILYISSQQTVNITEALSWFKLYCDSKEDLILKDDIQNAKEFIIKELIQNNKHIDFIITDWTLGNDNARAILNFIRDSKENYSDSNFQLRSLPIILIEDLESQSNIISFGFDATVSDFRTNHVRFQQTITSVIKKWRSNIADDLDMIGLDPKTQKIYPKHRSSFISYNSLRVLSRKFVDDKSKRLNYIWTNSDILSMSNSNQIFYDKMSWTIKNSPKYLEKEFHKFILSYPTFVKGEDFSRASADMLYEKHLYKNGTSKYDEIDFINKPYSYSLRQTEVFEIKRHTARLLRKDKTSFLSTAKKSFEQVKRYKRYMESSDPLHQHYIEKYLGKIYDSYSYTLLIGTNEEKQENHDLIEKLKADFEFSEINLLSYDELLERHIKLCDRLSEFGTFY